LRLLRYHVQITPENPVDMATPRPITIPTEPIGSIARPVDLVERVAKPDSEDPSLEPPYEDAIRETVERFEATGCHALKIVCKYRKPDQRIFVGVTAPVDPHIETPEEMGDRSFEPGKKCTGARETVNF
jgi:hypothetical protein